MKLQNQRVASGISGKTLMLYAATLCFRLSSTLWLNGYLPVCDSGDWFFQTVDIVALTIELWLIYQILVVRQHSYQVDADTFPLAPVVFGAFVLAIIFHADMNLRPLFDTMWMAGLFLSSIAVVPQLWLIMRVGGRVEAAMSHFIAVMAISRALSGLFWYIAREDTTPPGQWIEGVNHSIIAILGAHLLHLLLLGDFACYYLRALATQGLDCRLEFESIAHYV